MGKHTIRKFECSHRICIGPQAVFTCPLNLLYLHLANGTWKGIGEVIVSVPQTRLMSNDDCKSLKVPRNPNAC